MYGAQLMEALRRASAGTGMRPVQAERNSGVVGVTVGAVTQPTLQARTDGSETRPHDDLHFFGAGGDRMRAAGCEIILDAKDLPVGGITQILTHLPTIYE